MVGNVIEWTSSKWSDGFEANVWRGGSFNYDRGGSRSSFRSSGHPAGQGRDLGFRLARGIT
jgi:formylglycine-generating enzyme required for sulfatase activity